MSSCKCFVAAGLGALLVLMNILVPQGGVTNGMDSMLMDVCH